MNRYRIVTLGLLSLSMSAGCRTAGMGNLTQQEPLLPRSAATAKALVAELNRNAQRVETFEAKPSIRVDGAGGAFGADGYLAFARPQNFRLEMRAALQEVADIGSNDQEFWFWKRPERREKRSIYYCNYDENGESPLAGMLQPDWIIESLGFRVIPEEEAADITLRPGKDSKTLVLNHPQGVGTGIARFFRRETVLSETTHHILEHRVYDRNDVLLARASVGDRDYQTIAAGVDGQGESVIIPTKVRLEWLQDTQQPLRLDVSLSSPKVNREINAERRSALFVEPSGKGERINLAQLAGTTDGSRGPTVRHTRPAPPAGVKLGDPAPLGVDETRRAPRDPVALTADLGTFPTAEVTPPTVPDVIQPSLLGPDAQYPPPAGFAR